MNICELPAELKLMVLSFCDDYWSALALYKLLFAGGEQGFWDETSVFTRGACENSIEAELVLVHSDYADIYDDTEHQYIYYNWAHVDSDVRDFVAMTVQELEMARETIPKLTMRAQSWAAAENAMGILLITWMERLFIAVAKQPRALGSVPYMPGGCGFIYCDADYHEACAMSLTDQFEHVENCIVHMQQLLNIIIKRIRWSEDTRVDLMHRRQPFGHFLHGYMDSKRNHSFKFAQAWDFVNGTMFMPNE